MDEVVLKDETSMVETFKERVYKEESNHQIHPHNYLYSNSQIDDSNWSLLRKCSYRSVNDIDYIESLEMPDLRDAHLKRKTKNQEINEQERIEARLRREDEIQEIIKLSGMSPADKHKQLTKIEQTARDLRNEFKTMICKLTMLDTIIDNLVESAKKYEKSMIYQES